jgi:hypothetical protein
MRRSYDMDAAFMSFQQRGCGTHVVSAEPQRAADRDHQSRKSYENAGAPTVTRPVIGGGVAGQPDH